MANIIGIDIGGTKIQGIIWDGKYVAEELTIVTPTNLYDFERSILKLADFLSAKAKPSAIGIGIAGLVDSANGVVKHSPNIKFIKNLQLARFFKINGLKKVKLDNDANCFTRAEMLLGQGKKFKDFLALTLGTGVGGGVVINGNIYRGRQNAGAEFGHMVFTEGFMEKSYQQARDGRNFKALGRVVGIMMASIANIFTPEAIIIGGNLGHNEAKKYLPAAKGEMKKFLFDQSTEPKILISQLKNAGAVGAALLVK